MTDAQVIRYVRDFTTDNATELPDSVILRFAGRDPGNPYTYNADALHASGLDLYGIVADAWTYIARYDKYKSQTEGNLSVSGPYAVTQANYYYALSKRGQYAVSMGTITRGDITTATVVSEHAV